MHKKIQELIGVVCGKCFTYNLFCTSTCKGCGLDFIDGTPTVQLEKGVLERDNYLCSNCSHIVPQGNHFCGICGTPVHADWQDLPAQKQTKVGNIQLISLRGPYKGSIFSITKEKTTLGYEGCDISLSKDSFVSLHHATFYLRGKSFIVCDESNFNGLYIRIYNSVPIGIGDHFICGQEVLRLDPPPRLLNTTNRDRISGFPIFKDTINFCVTKLIEGGYEGTCVCAYGNTLSIGRVKVDMNFPNDIFISSNHASIKKNGDNFQLVDHNSRNGTYIRIKKDLELKHGDYMFIGRSLLYVAMT